MSEATEADPLAPTLKSIPCARCGELFMREHDLHVHTERHRPSPHLSREEREGKVHCPKGCGRWVELGNAEWEAHVELCDGSPPITGKPVRSGHKWWCEEHEFGTSGPRAWGAHKKEHHAGLEPAKTPSEKRKPREEVMTQVRRLLREELARLTFSKGKIEAEIGRIQAALKSLDSKNGAREA